MNNRLFVGNLTFGVSDLELKETFEPYGEVVSASIVVDRETGNSRGFAFVEYSNAEAAARAIESLDGVPLQGRNLTVNIARERGQRR